MVDRSILKEVKAGVPQVSVVCSILFSFFVDDYSCSLAHVKAVLYDDYRALSMSCDSMEPDTLVDRDLATTLNWFNGNNSVLNCKVK